MLLPFLNIYYFDNLAILITVWKIIPLLFVMVFIYYMKIDKFVLLFTLFLGVTLITSFIGGYLTLYIVFYFLSLYGLILMFHYYLKIDSKNTFRVLYILFVTIIILNAISILIGGLGVYAITGATEYLVGRENNVIRIIFPGMIIAYLYMKLFNNNKTTKVLTTISIIIGALSLLYLGSSTSIGIVGLFIFVILFKRMLPKFWILMIGYIVVFIMVIWGQSLKFMSIIIVNILGNNLTYSGRIDIWNYVTTIISENLLFGVGYGNTFVREMFYPVSEEHNMFLQLLLNSGLLGMSVFVIIIIYLAKELNLKGNQSQNYMYMTNILSFGIVAFLMIGIMESRIYDIGFWMLIVIASNIKYIVSKTNSTQ